MADDPKRQADRIIEALEKAALLDNWPPLGVAAVRATIVRTLSPEQPTFEALALELTGDSDDWPRDYQARFWNAYPRREAKDDAMRRLDKIRKSRKVSFDVILAAVELYSRAKRNSEVRFIALPATWLNKGRWKDDPAAISGSHGGGEVKNGFMGRLMES